MSIEGRRGANDGPRGVEFWANEGAETTAVYLRSLDFFLALPTELASYGFRVNDSHREVWEYSGIVPNDGLVNNEGLVIPSHHNGQELELHRFEYIGPREGVTIGAHLPRTLWPGSDLEATTTAPVPFSRTPSLAPKAFAGHVLSFDVDTRPATITLNLMSEVNMERLPD